MNSLVCFSKPALSTTHIKRKQKVIIWKVWLYVHTIPDGFSWGYEKLSGIVWTPSDKWLSALDIGAAQLRSVTEIVPPQPFLYMNSSHIQYDFRGCVKAIQHSLNIALINLHFVEQNANEKQIKRKWQLTVLEVDMHYIKKIVIVYSLCCMSG